MKSFILTSDHADTLIEHEFEIQNRLKNLKEEYRQKASEYCKNVIKNQLNYLEGENEREKCVLNLKENITKLVMLLWKKECKMSDEILEKEFNKKWKSDWVESKKVKYSEDHFIDQEISDVLKEKFNSQQTMITQKLSELSLQHRKPSSTIGLNPEIHLMSKNSMIFNAHIHTGSKCRSIFKYIPFGKVEAPLKDSEIEDARKYCNDLIHTAVTIINDTWQNNFQPLGSDKPLVTHILNQLLDSIKDKNGQLDCTFKFTKEFEIDCAISVCASIFHTIKASIDIIKTRDPFYYVEKLKATFFNDFKSQYNNVNKEEAAASSLCNLLVSPIMNDLQDYLRAEIVQDIKKHHIYSHSKRHYKVKILKDLAEHNNFSFYKAYLSDINSSLQYWAKIYVEQHCKLGENGKNRITILSETRLLYITQTVKDAVIDICKQTSNIKEWIENFHMKLSTILTLNKSAMLGIIAVQEVRSFHLFENFVIDGINKIELQIQEDISCSPSASANITSWENSPHLELCANLSGCTKMCPFCKEQCELGNPNHVGNHSIYLHRPECLGRYIWTQNQKLVLNLCTELVGSNATFQNVDTSQKPVPYKQYTKYYPDWDIPADTNADPLYWKWVTFKYQSEIQEWIGSKVTDIPPSWNVSVDAAIENLYDIYNIK